MSTVLRESGSAPLLDTPVSRQGERFTLPRRNAREVARWAERELKRAGLTLDGWRDALANPNRAPLLHHLAWLKVNCAQSLAAFASIVAASSKFAVEQSAARLFAEAFNAGEQYAAARAEERLREPFDKGQARIAAEANRARSVTEARRESRDARRSRVLAEFLAVAARNPAHAAQIVVQRVATRERCHRRTIYKDLRALGLT